MVKRCVSPICMVSAYPHYFHHSKEKFTIPVKAHQYEKGSLLLPGTAHHGSGYRAVIPCKSSPLEVHPVILEHSPRCTLGIWWLFPHESDSLLPEKTHHERIRSSEMRLPSSPRTNSLYSLHPLTQLPVITHPTTKTIP